MSLTPSCDGGDELLGHHQVGAVADHHEHLALRVGHLHAQPAGDLVAHARVAVLDVVALRVARAPELVQVAGHAARGADDDVARAADAVDDADHLGLGRERAVAGRVGGLDRGVPLARERRRAARVLAVGADSPRAPRAAPRGRRARRRRAASAGLLERVDRRDVEVDEAHAGLGEELREAVVKSLQRVPTPSTTSASRASALAAVVPVAPIAPTRLRVVVGQRALAGLRLGDGDPGRLGELAQRVGRLGVDRAAAGDDQRLARAAQQRRGLGQHVRLGHGGRRTCQTRRSNSSSGQS